MSRPLVSVIIPNWNGTSLLKTCLSSLKKQSIKNFEVIVVDNGSTDDSVSYIKKNFPRFKVIQLPKNMGFATAANVGIKKALGENIILLNNDTETDKNCIKHLVTAAKNHSEVGMVTAKIKNFYNRNIIDNVGDEVDIVGHSFTRGTGKKDGSEFDRPGYLFLVTGGGALFRREIFKKIGYFDDSYFFYMEDVDFGFRAQLAGFKAWYEPKAVIYHIRMATSSKNMAMVEPICFRNMTMNIIKDYPLSLIFYNFNWLKIILVNLNTIKYLASKGYLWGALKAEWYILVNLKTLLKKRKEIQKLKIVSDQYIINNVKERRLLIPFFKIRF